MQGAARLTVVSMVTLADSGEEGPRAEGCNEYGRVEHERQAYRVEQRQSAVGGCIESNQLLAVRPVGGDIGAVGQGEAASVGLEPIEAAGAVTEQRRGLSRGRPARQGQQQRERQNERRKDEQGSGAEAAQLRMR